MGILSKGFKEIKKADEPLYKTPKSVQQTIEIMKVAENGMFEVSKNRYSKCYRFSDINYATVNSEEQEAIFESYCRFLNSMDCTFKITINNKNRDMEELRNFIQLPYMEDGYDRFRKIYNDIIEDKIREGRQGIEKEMYITVTIRRNNFEEAKAYFATIEATLYRTFGELGATVSTIDCNGRIKILHDFYHLGEEAGFEFDIRNAKKKGTDFKNDICNSMLKYYPDHMEDEGKYSRALFIKKYPNNFPVDFINKLVSLPIHCMISIDTVPVPKDMTTKMLQKKYLGIESDIIRQQRVRNKNNDFSSDISYVKRTEKREIEAIMDDVRENDQNLFYVAVTVVLVAESMEELDAVTRSVMAVGNNDSVTFDIHYYRQREALNTALPVGVRQVETMRSMLTQSLAGLLPFNVQEMNDRGGIYYGINRISRISRNVNVGNRKKLINGNGFVFGVPGSGKSFFCKQGMGQVFLNTGDDVIVIDPMNEYFDIAGTFGGTVINLSAYTDNYVNPLDADLVNTDAKGLRDIIAEKSDLMLGICDQLLGNMANLKHKSVIDRCIKDLYMDAYKTKKVPLMTELYGLLKEKTEPEAQELVLCLELFVEGSLNIFNHHTNVDSDNRFTVYGIQDMGTQLAPVAMLVMMESIQSRIIENGRKGRATWLYVDECHVLLKSTFSANYLQQLWKKVRKQGGLCTGISQNVTDLLQNDTAASLISNSEFIALLKQSKIDSAKLAEAIGVSDAQLGFVKNSSSGTGLIKCGSIVIPFDNTISKDTELYRLYNTNIHEKIAMGLMKDDGQAEAGDNGNKAVEETVAPRTEESDPADMPEKDMAVNNTVKNKQAGNSWLIY